MTTITSFLLLISFSIFNTACKKDTETICENLLGQGSASQSILKGEWEFEYFAFTTNGSKIKNEDKILKGHISVTDTGSIWLYHTNTINYEYTLNNSNSIAMVLKGSTYVNPPQEEIDVSNAFNNAECFVVKENSLLIHYTETDKKNVLILKKK